MIAAINLRHRLAALGVSALLATAPAAPAQAQGLDAEGAIDTIVGSDVVTGEEEAGSDEERIVAAIEDTVESTSRVRRAFTLDAVELVFLPEMEQSPALVAKVEEFSDEIGALQVAIEGSAMFYHAVNSNRVMLRDIVALEFGDDNGVTIFVAGNDPRP